MSAGRRDARDADGALLKRALWNLVENAAKYGAPPIALAADAAGGDRVSFSVTRRRRRASRPRSASGCFEPFYRGDKARTPGRAPGFGLGLTLARRVAEVHGGALTVGPASTDGGRERGCRVVITIPASPGRASD